MIDPRGFLTELRRRSPVLVAVGWLHVVFAVIAVPLMAFDDRVILGIDPWIKPMKFAVSITIYLWTLAWFLGYLEKMRRTKVVVAWAASLFMIGESTCIWMQSARGVASHFNGSTAFDGKVFAAMGLFILANTVLIAVLIVVFFVRRIDTTPAERWGLRSGLLIFFVGSAIGGAMLLNGGHAVGVPDGGLGLPFVNWSTQGGDLRIAHALGLHGMQLLPFAGWWIGRRAETNRAQLLWFGVVLAGYVAAIAWTYLRAQAGMSLVAA